MRCRPLVARQMVLRTDKVGYCQVEKGDTKTLHTVAKSKAKTQVGTRRKRRNGETSQVRLVKGEKEEVEGKREEDGESS